MKYDDASWHLEGLWPDGLPEIQASVMPGMFFVWAVLHDLASEEHLTDVTVSFKGLKEKLENRDVTPAEYFNKTCDGKLTDQDLNDEGNEFALAYYEGEDGGEKFLTDYLTIFGDHEDSPYHVPNTWEAYDRYSPTIDKRFKEWKKT
jgi:hypothetical protein